MPRKNSSRTILAAARRVVAVELDAVAALRARLDADFTRAVRLLQRCRGRVIVTGMGKSGNVAQKFVATLNSTGTPSVYLHPSDAMHGDLGMVQRHDVVVAISKSGDTPELRTLLPLLRRVPVRTLALVGNMRSALAREAHVALNVGVAAEACPMNLAPTASTTAALVMCDALAVALLEQKGFSEEDFASVHPGGQLGLRLRARVADLMVRAPHVPVVRATTPLRDAIVEISRKRLGATCVVDARGALAGIITDGDLRRFLERTTAIGAAHARDAMTRAPKTTGPAVLAQAALEQMETFKITQLVVIDRARRPVGMLHLHDLVRAGFEPRSSEGLE